MDNEVKLTYKELYNDLVRARTQTVQPEGTFTVRQFVRDTGMSPSQSAVILRAKVEDGSLERKSMVLNGRRTNVYWFTTQLREK